MLSYCKSCNRQNPLSKLFSNYGGRSSQKCGCGCGRSPCSCGAEFATDAPAFIKGKKVAPDLLERELHADYNIQPVDTHDVQADYSGDAIQQIGLESDIKESHNRFITEVHHRTTGASAAAVRSDDNDINPWVGLRRPNYWGGNAYSQNDARVVSSEDPSQMPMHRVTGLI
jgi:hypothetical protein